MQYFKTNLVVILKLNNFIIFKSIPAHVSSTFVDKSIIHLIITEKSVEKPNIFHLFYYHFIMDYLKFFILN